MNMNRKHWWFIPLVSGLLIAPSVNAGAIYAVSSLGVSNLGVKLSNPGYFTGFSINTSTASLGGAGTGSADSSDAAASCLGCSYNNSFVSHGPSAMPYAYGDALISGVINGLASASGIAETSVISGTGSASASNSFKGYISLNTSGTQLSFSFNADPLLTVMPSPGSIAGAANTTFSVTLTDLSGKAIFAWVPDGMVGNVLGGIEMADPFNLNLGLSSMSSDISVYDPSVGLFSAMSNPLAKGVYQLNISMFNSAFVDGGTVPEPGVLSLLAGGLAGLFLTRRKRAV